MIIIPLQGLLWSLLFETVALIWILNRTMWERVLHANVYHVTSQLFCFYSLRNNCRMVGRGQKRRPCLGGGSAHRRTDGEGFAQ